MQLLVIVNQNKQSVALDCNPVAASAMAEDICYWMWHARLGHPGQYQIDHLKKAWLLDIHEGDELCEPCIKGKRRELMTLSLKNSLEGPRKGLNWFTLMFGGQPQ